MTFEDQLTSAFDTLTERLRGEIDQQVQRATAELWRWRHPIAVP